ncbi:hypothetical protein KM043_002182 [Ampulex compressa]|nr:hypothetical protein KM043_002182 [Ampulex compressa]
MGTSDLWMRDVVTSYGLIVVLFACVAYYLSQKWSKLCENCYKAHLLGFEMECAELAAPYKKDLFESLQQIISHDKVLRSMGCIRILEIGVKTGENIQFYPDGAHLICVDWNKKLGEYLIGGSRCWQFSHVIIERLIIGDGSSLKEVPSESVDVVVTTRSLCSVRSIRLTLQEIHRVLTPDGKYFFVEHISEKNGTLVPWLQKAFSRTGIWPSLFGNCRLDSDPITEIEKVGFKEVSWTPVVLEGYVSKTFHLMLSRHHAFGVAIR